MNDGSASVENRAQQYELPGWPQTTWLIARRAALESLRDRTTLWTSMVFALILPAAIVVGLILPSARDAHTLSKEQAVGSLIAMYLFVVGLGPSSSSIGIASGVFAGEKEKGNLAPLLATPASNAAIFAGKVLGAVLPTLVYALAAEIVYMVLALVIVGADTLRFIPAGLAVCALLLVLCTAVLGASVASLISSRARTYSGAQMGTSLAMFPIMGILFGITFALHEQAPAGVGIEVLCVVIIDALLLRIGATTWRREEVMATL
jgi:ABC-type Na+ efflux pump permease subunit